MNDDDADDDADDADDVDTDDADDADGDADDIGVPLVLHIKQLLPASSPIGCCRNTPGRPLM